MSELYDPVFVDVIVQNRIREAKNRDPFIKLGQLTRVINTSIIEIVDRFVVDEEILTELRRLFVLPKQTIEKALQDSYRTYSKYTEGYTAKLACNLVRNGNGFVEAYVNPQGQIFTSNENCNCQNQPCAQQNYAPLNISNVISLAYGEMEEILNMLQERKS